MRQVCCHRIFFKILIKENNYVQYFDALDN